MHLIVPEEGWGNIEAHLNYPYNYQRLHAGIRYLRSADLFFNRQGEVLNERKEKLLLVRIDRIRQNNRRKLAA